MTKKNIEFTKTNSFVPNINQATLNIVETKRRRSNLDFQMFILMSLTAALKACGNNDAKTVDDASATSDGKNSSGESNVKQGIDNITGETDINNSKEENTEIKIIDSIINPTPSIDPNTGKANDNTDSDEETKDSDSKAGDSKAGDSGKDEDEDTSGNEEDSESEEDDSESNSVSDDDSGNIPDTDEKKGLLELIDSISQNQEGVPTKEDINYFLTAVNNFKTDITDSTHLDNIVMILGKDEYKDVFKNIFKEMIASAQAPFFKEFSDFLLKLKNRPEFVQKIIQLIHIKAMEETVFDFGIAKLLEGHNDGKDPIVEIIKHLFSILDLSEYKIDFQFSALRLDMNKLLNIAKLAHAHISETPDEFFNALIDAIAYFIQEYKFDDSNVRTLNEFFQKDVAKILLHNFYINDLPGFCRFLQTFKMKIDEISEESQDLLLKSIIKILPIFNNTETDIENILKKPSYVKCFYKAVDLINGSSIITEKDKKLLNESFPVGDEQRLAKITSNPSYVLDFMGSMRGKLEPKVIKLIKSVFGLYYEGLDDLGNLFIRDCENNKDLTPSTTEVNEQEQEELKDAVKCKKWAEVIEFIKKGVEFIKITPYEVTVILSTQDSDVKPSEDSEDNEQKESISINPLSVGIIDLLFNEQNEELSEEFKTTRQELQKAIDAHRQGFDFYLLLAISETDTAKKAKYLEKAQETFKDKFYNSKIIEMNGKINMGVFVYIPEEELENAYLIPTLDDAHEERQEEEEKEGGADSDLNTPEQKGKEEADSGLTPAPEQKEEEADSDLNTPEQKEKEEADSGLTPTPEQEKEEADSDLNTPKQKEIDAKDSSDISNGLTEKAEETETTGSESLLNPNP